MTGRLSPRWDPPRFLALEWRPDPAQPAATRVEVTFEAVGDVICRVTLVHRGWHLLGPSGPEVRDSHEAGWPAVLARFGLAALPVEVLETVARQTNQACWALLDRSERSDEDDALLLHVAHTSAWCWSRSGGPVEATRAAWLVVAGPRGDRRCWSTRRASLRWRSHAAKRTGIGGFDLAYAYEAMARAAAANGDATEARRWYRSRSRSERDRRRRRGPRPCRSGPCRRPLVRPRPRPQRALAGLRACRRGGERWAPTVGARCRSPCWPLRWCAPGRRRLMAEAT